MKKGQSIIPLFRRANSIQLNLAKTALIFTFMLLPFLSWGQNEVVDISSSKTTVETKAVDGTFQLVKTSKIQELLTTETIKEIQFLAESNRHQTEEILISFSAYTQIRVLPFSVINDPDFEPVETLFEEN